MEAFSPQRDSINPRGFAICEQTAAEALETMDRCDHFGRYASRVRLWRQVLDVDGKGCISQMEFVAAMRAVPELEIDALVLWRALTGDRYGDDRMYLSDFAPQATALLKSFLLSSVVHFLGIGEKHIDFDNFGTASSSYLQSAVADRTTRKILPAPKLAAALKEIQQKRAEAKLNWCPGHDVARLSLSVWAALLDAEAGTTNAAGGSRKKGGKEIGSTPGGGVQRCGSAAMRVLLQDMRQSLREDVQLEDGYLLFTHMTRIDRRGSTRGVCLEDIRWLFCDFPVGLRCDPDSHLEKQELELLRTFTSTAASNFASRLMGEFDGGENYFRHHIRHAEDHVSLGDAVMDRRGRKEAEEKNALMQQESKRLDLRPVRL
ncbi:unnamed protein product [Amoebophrya sp. A25]|nr:unnamed protein product [Amoebophrya sp. A25]|eukprot:GSA25T00020985001.1